METPYCLCTKGSLDQCLPTRVSLEITEKIVWNTANNYEDPLKYCRNFCSANGIAAKRNKLKRHIERKPHTDFVCELAFWCLCKLSFDLISCICRCMWVEITDMLLNPGCQYVPYRYVWCCSRGAVLFAFSLLPTENMYSVHPTLHVFYTHSATSFLPPEQSFVRRCNTVCPLFLSTTMVSHILQVVRECVERLQGTLAHAYVIFVRQ